jgi:hypothetical protein
LKAFEFYLLIIPKIPLDKEQIITLYYLPKFVNKSGAVSWKKRTTQVQGFKVKLTRPPRLSQPGTCLRQSRWRTGESDGGRVKERKLYAAL